MKEYNPEEVVLSWGPPDHTVVGWSEDTVIQMDTPRQWYTLEGVLEDGTHKVSITSTTGDLWSTSFTKKGYDQYLKGLQPSLVSPFSIVDGDLK